MPRMGFTRPFPQPYLHPYRFLLLFPSLNTLLQTCCNFLGDPDWQRLLRAHDARQPVRHTATGFPFPLRSVVLSNLGLCSFSGCQAPSIAMSYAPGGRRMVEPREGPCPQASQPPQPEAREQWPGPQRVPGPPGLLRHSLLERHGRRWRAERLVTVVPWTRRAGPQCLGAQRLLLAAPWQRAAPAAAAPRRRGAVPLGRRRRRGPRPPPQAGPGAKGRQQLGRRLPAARRRRGRPQGHVPSAPRPPRPPLL